jgi:hypothetical protein
MRASLLALLMSAVSFAAWADTADEAAAEEAAAKQSVTAKQATTEDESAAEPDNGDGIKSPKTMSGMSILGNEEAPKSLVIVPWKSSRMGDELDLSDTLDDRAQPVDKEVFLREMRFYKIRSGEQT